MNYEELMEKSNDCTKKATMFYHLKELDLVVFWKNASNEFKNRAMNLFVD